MQQIMQRLCKGRYVAMLSLATLALVLGITPIAPAETALAHGCRVYAAVGDFYEAGAIATKIEYVPNSTRSSCKDINVRNIKNQNVAGDYCATFKVQMFPTSGGDFYTNPKTVCSQDPDGAGPANGPVMPIATDVLNGTKYRVWYNVENLGWQHTFQIVD